MSTLKAEVVTVTVLPHPGADRLDVIVIDRKMWRCVAGKGQFKTGDLAVYLPVDSVIPAPLIKDLGIEKLYSKKLKTIKLRGCVSQGMVIPLPGSEGSRIPNTLGHSLVEGDDLTEMLGIKKFEEIIPTHMNGIQLPNHPGFPKYTDIENIKNFPNVFEPGEQVVVCEKLHGTNGRAALIEGKLFVGGHNMNLAESETNLYWRAARQLNLSEKLREGEQVFFEVYGHKIQDLHYGKKPGEIGVGIFDWMRDQTYLDHQEFLDTLQDRGLLGFVVPLVKIFFWDTALLPGITEGQSLIAPDQIREGVVLRPIKERYSEVVSGRCIIKSISETYLCRHDGTERH